MVANGPSPGLARGAAPEPTHEQRCAIEVEGSAAVRAGAGSGKTAVLAGRFLHVLRRGSDGRPPVEQVNQILAITFTEKAAAEMTRRIRELLAEEIAAAAGPERQRWERIRRELLGAQVSTIHAFCARVVRENPLEAGIDPGAIVLDEHQSRDYLETAVEEELVARLRAGDGAARELLLRCRRLRGGLRGGAVELCVRWLDWLGRTGRDGAWLVAATARQVEGAPEAVAALREKRAPVFKGT